MIRSVEAAAPTAARAADGASPLARAGLVAGLALQIGLCLWLFGYAQDDAFITYRYAANLRHGYGPVFNPGDHTEGYSAPLYMVLTSLLLLLPGDPLFKAKLLGAAFGAASVWAVWRLARRLGLPDWAQAAAALVVGGSASVALSSVDGMETSLQMLLVTMAAGAMVREQQAGRGWSSALWMLGVCLNRPEGVLYALAAAALVLARSARRGADRGVVAWAAALVVPLLLFLAWRRWFYGAWLPNTYYAKAMPFAMALEPRYGPGYLARTVFVNLHGRPDLIAAGVLLWVAALGGATSDRLRRNAGSVIPLFVLAQAVVALRAGGDWMPGWRYMMAVVPLWWLLIMVGLVDASRGIGRAGAAARRLAAAAGCAALVAVCAWAAPGFHKPTEGAVSWWERGWATTTRGFLRGYRMENTVILADYLRSAVPAGSTVAYSEMGATPFLTPGIRYLDTYGLTDAQVTRLPGLTKFRSGVLGDYTDPRTEIGRHLLTRRPDFVLRWLPAGQPAWPVLGGTYVPFGRVALRDFGERGPTVAQLWKRRD